VKVPWWDHHTLRMSASHHPNAAQMLGEFGCVEIQARSFDLVVGAAMFVIACGLAVFASPQLS